MSKKIALNVESGILSVAGKTIAYIVKQSGRARRMTIKISRDRKLEVIIPTVVPTPEGHRFLHEHQDWVIKKLQLLLPVQKTYLYFGIQYKLAHLHNREGTKHKISLEQDTLYIESPFGSTVPPATIFEQFIKYQGKKYLSARCIELAAQNGFPVKKITVRGQKSRWGSCSRRGSVSLNFRLMQLRKEMIDYVIMHELCHLRHMNHSKDFWNEVGKYIPGFKALDKELNKFRL